MKGKKVDNRNFWKQVSLGLLAAAICMPQAGYAADKAEEFTLDSMLVTAQRRETSDLNTAAAVTVITAEELKATGAISVFDALEHVTGVSGVSTGAGGAEFGMTASRINIRGFNQGTLVLVNGSPINLLNYNGTGGIPLAAVERVEVIKGAASTLYGAEALGGVINIITKKPGEDKKTTVSLTGGNYNKSWSVGTDFEKGSLYVQREYTGDITRTSRDNISAAQYYGLNKGYKNSLFYTMQLNDRLNFNWSYADSQSNRPRYNANGSNYIDYVYDDVRNNVNFVYTDEENNYRSVLSYNNRQANADKYTYSTKNWGISERYDMYSINWDNQKSWQLRNDLDTLIAGVTIDREHYNGLASSTATIRNNTRRDSFAAYGSYTYVVNPRFNTTLGLRGHFVNDYTGRENVFLPQLQTLYKINDTASWYTNIGKSFQMAAINQYFLYTGRIDPLKPQVGWNYETGFKVIEQNQSWKLAVYHMDIKDKLDWITDANPKYMTNVGDFRNTGIELEYTKKVDNNWKYNLGISYSNPEVQEKGNPWTQFSGRVQTTAGITHNKDKWLSNVNFLFIGDREVSGYKINGKVSDVPDRIQLNAAVRYQAAENQSIALNLYNMLDRDNSLTKYENLDLPFNWTLNYTYSF